MTAGSQVFTIAITVSVLLQDYSMQELNLFHISQSALSQLNYTCIDTLLARGTIIQDA